MARYRTIKPEFWTSEQVVECSLEARLLFIGLWNFADDGGVIPQSNKSLKMKIFPADDYTSETIRIMLDELSSNGLIELYEVGESRYIRVIAWHHQKIDKPTFKFPQPCGEVPRDKQHYLDMCSTSARRGLTPGKERKGKELKSGESKNINSNNAHARAGEFAKFGVDRFKPSSDDLEYCEQLELAEPIAIITAGFVVYHEDRQSLHTEQRWSELFRGWVEKNIVPPVNGE